MKIQNEVSNEEVLQHWEKVEDSDGGFRNGRRADMLDELATFQDLRWYEAVTEKEDVDSIFIISSYDWVCDGFCVPDFRLTTAVRNYKNESGGGDRLIRIKGAEQKFLESMASLDTKFLYVSDNDFGPYTIIEGNKRSVALTAIDRIIGIQVYLGISRSIRSSDLAMFTYRGE